MLVYVYKRNNTHGIIPIFFCNFLHFFFLLLGAMQFVRTVYQSIVDSIWDHAVEDGHVVAEDTITTQKRAVEVYRKHLLDMEQKKVPIKEFIYSKGLTSAPSKYKNKSTPHVQVSLPVLFVDMDHSGHAHKISPMGLVTFPLVQTSNCVQTIWLVQEKYPSMYM